MFVDTKRLVEVNNRFLPYADVYVEDAEEAATVLSTDYVIGSKMYIVPTGMMYVACSTGWYDTDGTALS